jgi:Tol biopolymer transport system component
MTDLRERFRELDSIAAPDLRPEILTRPRKKGPGGDLPRRAGIALLALCVAAGGFVVALRAFRTDQEAGREGAVANGKIAFVRQIAVGSSEIVVVDPDGSGWTSLIEVSGHLWDPAWSPDGTRIAFGGGGELAGESGLYVMSADGSGRALLLEDGTGATSPTWSPDGESIVFESGRGHEQTGGDRDIYRIDVETGALLRLTDDPSRDYYPAISPDGARIAFTRWRRPQTGDGAEIWVMNADGSGAIRLASGLAPTWSPDGTRITFHRDDDIYVMDADGTGITNLTDDPAYDGRPAWSPDGTRIAFTSDRDGDADIYVMNPDGSRVTHVTDDPGTEGQPAWQPLPAALSTTVESGGQLPSVVPRVTATIPVGIEGNVGSILYAHGSVWVTARDADGSGEVLRIDPATNEVVARIPAAAVPGWEVGGAGIAAGAGALWVTGGGDTHDGEFGALLQRIDPETGEMVASISLEGRFGEDVVVDPSGVWVVLAGEEDFTEVVRVDPVTNEIVARVRLGQQWAHWIGSAGGMIVVHEHRTFSGGRGGVFTAIDPSTNEIVWTVEPEGNWTTWGMATWDDLVWTTAHDVLGLNAATGEVLDLVDAPIATSGTGMVSGEGGIWLVGYNPSGGRSITLNRLDPASGLIDLSAEVPEAGGIAIAAGNGAVWVLEYEGTVTRIDLVPAAELTPAEATLPFVAPRVGRFMEARMEGLGAEASMSEDALTVWGSPESDLQPLYSPPDVRYETFRITFVEERGDGTYAVGVRVLGAHLDGVDEWFTEPLFEETLLAGPGVDPTGGSQPLLVTGGQPGLERP